MAHNDLHLPSYAEHPTKRHARCKLHGSKLGHIMYRIHEDLNYEQEQSHLDPPTESTPAAVTLSQEQTRSESPNLEELAPTMSLSPSIQARRSSELNENSMGPTHQGWNWGWPSLAISTSTTAAAAAATTTTTTTPMYSIGKDDAKVRTFSHSSLARSNSLKKRAQAATFEAIDNAAECESYGWPVVGYWPSTRK